jgi:hypothetical protein
MASNFSASNQNGDKNGEEWKEKYNIRILKSGLVLTVPKGFKVTTP